MSSEHKKVCFKCGRELDMDGFYKHKRMSDGHANKCKECALLDDRLRRERNGDLIRLRDRTYKRSKVSKSICYTNRVEKLRARCALSYAIRRGRITKGMFCERCWSTGRIHGHHTDYSKPLSVIWLCPLCHAQAHLSNRIDCSEVASLRDSRTL